MKLLVTPNSCVLLRFQNKKDMSGSSGAEFIGVSLKRAQFGTAGFQGQTPCGKFVPFVEKCLPNCAEEERLTRENGATMAYLGEDALVASPWPGIG